jgi:TatD DNase family protein
MHCFGGTLQQAESYVALGFLVSIPCSVTYPNNHESRRIAATLPGDSLVVETDSPYLPPQRRRGKRNEPAYVVAAVEEIAAARNVTFEGAGEMTTANACRLFGISIPELAGTT